MESEEGVRWRKPGLRPIETDIKSREIHGRDEETRNNNDVVLGEEEPVSPGSRVFHEPNFNVHVLAIMGSKYKIQIDIAKANLPNTLLKHPRFSSLLVVDEKDGRRNMKWVRTEVDVDNHLIVPDIDPNMETTSPDEYVENYIYNLTKTSLDTSKPLWEAHVLNLKTSDAEGIVVFRIHHSLGDGTSLMSLLLACTRQTGDPTALPTLPSAKRRNDKAKGGGGRGFIRSYSQCFLWGLWWPLRLLWNTFVDLVVFMATTSFLKDTDTPISGHSWSVRNPRRIVYKTVSLDDMKLVKNAMNMTINDVALGITQAGLSKYLNRRYGEIRNDDQGTTEKQNNLPKNIRLRSVVLINLRPAAGIQELANMMEKNTEAKWGNWIGYVLLPFDICLRDDPLDYIRKAKATIDRKKHSLEALFTSSMAKLVLKIFGIKIASAISHKIFCNTTMAFSNLVGPLEEIGIYGHSMEYLASTSYGQPHALMVNFQSYINKMTIVLSVDESVIPDAHQLCGDIAESLKLVKDSVVEKL
ncbi:wax ester synthase/diacylglycerol acyltransferase 11-like [Humulus lupulus]|uniref:wax ester synthase/diacylglycerol acyltransferase 11-like n=1 Tax=Humulus lupulus TaxID=3486 RepID=UPI002B409C0C|nr:wax ester synthase/diacylglycerol acyltransferase 11-like [Humulus lupulus]